MAFIDSIAHSNPFYSYLPVADISDRGWTGSSLSATGSVKAARKQDDPCSFPTDLVPSLDLMEPLYIRTEVTGLIHFSVWKRTGKVREAEKKKVRKSLFCTNKIRAL